MRAAAARALGQIGDGRAKESVEALQKDKSEVVRTEASKALEKLSGFGLDMDFDMEDFLKME